MAPNPVQFSTIGYKDPASRIPLFWLFFGFRGEQNSGSFRLFPSKGFETGKQGNTEGNTADKKAGPERDRPDLLSFIRRSLFDSLLNDVIYIIFGSISLIYGSLLCRLVRLDSILAVPCAICISNSESLFLELEEIIP